MAGKFPLTIRFVMFVLLVIGVPLGWMCARYSFSSSLFEGTLDLSGSGVDVSIVNDEHGVPHVHGKTDRDVFFAMGYLHASERMWQLEMQRRVARGTLSEVLGPGVLRQDVWMRTLGVYEASRSAWPGLTEEARDSLRAYAAGINTWLDGNPVLPPEFALQGVVPEHWQEIDSLAWTKVFALSLSGNFSAEINRYLLGQQLTRAELSSLFPGSGDADVAPSDHRGEHLDSLTDVISLHRSLEHDFGIGGKYVGSNAWVISRHLTRDGSAILANDPHLALQIPPPWFPVVQSGDRLRVKGMSLVGLPVVIFGRNDRIAWGGTNLMADVQDLYFEQFDATDPGRYRTPDGWQQVAVRQEIISVKQEFPASLRNAFAPVRVNVTSTRHGPVITDAVGQINERVSLQWTALAGTDRSYESFLRLGYAHDWDTFREAFREHVAPALHMLYADNTGHIGSLAVGKIPLRQRGDGSLPVPGWSEEYGWRGFIPFDRMPQSYDPDMGYIVTANNRIVDDAYPYFISSNWAPASRAQRIEQLVRQYSVSGEPATAEQTQQIQRDLLSLPARKLLPVLVALPATDPLHIEALDRLKQWNGEMDEASVGASLFTVWMRHLRLRLFVPRLDQDWGRHRARSHLEWVLAQTSLDVIYDALTDTRGLWCESSPKSATTQTPQRPRCEEILTVSFADALIELRKLRGGDMDSWRWGSIHENVYEHLPFSKVKGLSLVFERRIASGGSEDTVSASAADYREAEGYRGTHGASFRQVMQLGPAGITHQFMNTAGQSGNPFSGRYSNLLQPFAAGQYYSLANCLASRSLDPMGCGAAPVPSTPRQAIQYRRAR